MLTINSTNARIWSKLGARGTYGVAMLDLGATLDNLMVLTADLANTSGLDRFRTAYPEKFLNLGIAENNMVNVGAGLAKEGYTVFATTFSNFAAGRSYEQIRLSLGYMKFNVNIVGIASGMAIGMFGNTHYGIEDAALMRAIPNLTIICPADGAEIVKTVSAAANYDGPVYIRLTGAMNNPIVYKEEYDFKIGKAVSLREGHDIAIIASGTMVYESLVAANLLGAEGISASVINMHTIKPLDTNSVDKALHHKLIVTVEEHSVIGGLGGAVAEYKSTKSNAPKQLFIGLPDSFGKAGHYKYLLEKYGLVGASIAQKIAEEWKALNSN